MEQRLFPRRLPPDLQQHAGADQLQHARHHGHDGGTDRQHVGGQVLDPAAIDDLGPEARQEELADGVLETVRQRQERQIGLVAQAQRAHQLKGAAAIGQDGPVRQHHAARQTGGAAGVDQAGERAGRDFVGLGGDVVGRYAVGLQAGEQRAAAGLHAEQPVEPAGQRRAGQHAVGECGRGSNGHSGAAVQ